MAAVLIRKTFRYDSGSLARGESILVLPRGGPTSSALSSETTNSLGAISFYIEEGEYDFYVLGYRVPFDAIASLPGGGDGDGVALAAHLADLTPHPVAQSGRDFAGWYNAATII